CELFHIAATSSAPDAFTTSPARPRPRLKDIHERIAAMTCALMRPSTGPRPKRGAKASAAAWVASSRRAGARASSSVRSGGPGQKGLATALAEEDLPLRDTAWI